MRGLSVLDSVALFSEERLENRLLASFSKAIHLSCSIRESYLPHSLSISPHPHLYSTVAFVWACITCPCFPEASGGRYILSSITLHMSGCSDLAAHSPQRSKARYLPAVRFICWPQEHMGAAVGWMSVLAGS